MAADPNARAEVAEEMADVLAYLLARWSFRHKAWIELVIDLPIVLPPMVAGIGLLLLGIASLFVGALDAVLLLDVARASEREGLTAWFDVARWLQPSKAALKGARDKMDASQFDREPLALALVVPRLKQHHIADF